MANFWTEQDSTTKLWHWLLDTGYKSISGFPTRGSAQDTARLVLKHHSIDDVPYPKFCHHPDKCAGLGSCPRDPCCCD